MLAHPAAFDLVAVTTVCGDTRLRARIAARLLGLAGRTHVDVCAGERAPLLRPESRFVWFGHESDPLPEGPDARLPDESAPERIVRAAHEHPGLELVAVGPLTNVARAVALDPKLPQRVAGLTVMGGHVRSVRLGTKELPHGIDYNLCSDPEATVAVLGAGFRTTLVTADVTLQTWMGPADLARIEAGGPVARAIGAMLRTWTGVQKKLFSSWGGPEPSEFVAFLHDPLTVQALVDASPLRFETLRIVPTIERGVLRTIEVPAGAGLGAGLGAEMQVATGVDALAARDVIVGGLASL